MIKTRIGIAYVRKSQEKQKEYSISSQITKANEYASDNHIQIIKIFQEMRSGWKKGQRIEFFKMVDFIANNRIDDLLFFTPDRISRNMDDYYRLKHAVEESKLYDERKDTYLTLHKIIDKKKFRLNHEDDFEAAIDHEKEILEGDRFSRRTRRMVINAFDEKLKQGEYPGYPPIGYQPNLRTHEIEPDPDRFDLVKRGFKLYLTGKYSVDGLRKQYEYMGLLSRPTARNAGTEIPICKGEVDFMLKNPFYYGHFRWRGKIWSNCGINNDKPPTYPPMITQAEHENIKEILSGNRIGKSSHYGAGHLFKGIIKCECGRSPVWMPRPKILKTTGEKVTYHYYYCQRCKRSIKLEDIEHALLKDMNLFLPDEEAMNNLIKDLGEQVQEIHTAVNTEIQYLHKRQTEIGNKITGLTDKLAAIQDDKDLDNILIAQIKKYQRERDDLKAQKQELVDKNDDSVDEVVEIIKLTKSFKTKYLQSDTNIRHRMLKVMYKTIHVRDIPQYVLEKSPHLRFYITHNEPFASLFEKGLDKHAAEWWEKNKQKKALRLSGGADET